MLAIVAGLAMMALPIVNHAAPHISVYADVCNEDDDEYDVSRNPAEREAFPAWSALEITVRARVRIAVPVDKRQRRDDQGDDDVKSIGESSVRVHS